VSGVTVTSLRRSGKVAGLWLRCWTARIKRRRLVLVPWDVAGGPIDGLRTRPECCADDGRKAKGRHENEARLATRLGGPESFETEHLMGSQATASAVPPYFPLSREFSSCAIRVGLLREARCGW
jgi:hypothetical protein